MSVPLGSLIRVIGPPLIVDAERRKANETRARSLHLELTGNRYKSFDWRVRTHFRHVALEDLCEKQQVFGFEMKECRGPLALVGGSSTPTLEVPAPCGGLLKAQLHHYMLLKHTVHDMGNTHDQELFSFHRDHSPCDDFEESNNLPYLLSTLDDSGLGGRLGGGYGGFGGSGLSRNTWLVAFGAHNSLDGRLSISMTTLFMVLDATSKALSPRLRCVNPYKSNERDLLDERHRTKRLL
ncbi:hypothetical protein Syun_028953 [Stephania yunnanensis]|uniref:Uncharacterized protein n=1 Tax=Stephania yunnanensis TaxID=152371 RepID=A0AAP0ECQ5_9MAGN